MPTSLYNTLIQRRADLTAEGEHITAAAAAVGSLTDAQRSRLDEIDAELRTVDGDIGRAEAQRERERLVASASIPAAPSSELAPGAGGVVQRIHDRAGDMPWGYHYGVRTVQRADGTAGLTAAGGPDRALNAAWGDFLQAVYRARTQGTIDPRLVPEAAGQGANESVGADGGYLVGSDMLNEIMLRMTGGSVISLCRRVGMSSGANSIDINVIDETSRATGSRFGGVQAYWVDEGTAITASRPKFSRVQLKPRKVAALGYATDELLSDVALLGSIMQSAFGEELGFQLEDAIIEGTGAGQPLGILKASSLITVSAEAGQIAATIVNDNIVKMWARLDARSQANAVWFVNQDVQPQLDQLAILAGTAALEPRYVAYGPDGVLRIKGRPVVPVEYCSTLGTVGDIVLADLSQYLVVDKGGVQQASSMHVAFTTDEMAFRATYRVDGQPLWRSALTPFKGTNTVSPFVALATR